MAGTSNQPRTIAADPSKEVVRNIKIDHNKNKISKYQEINMQQGIRRDGSLIGLFPLVRNHHLSQTRLS